MRFSLCPFVLQFNRASYVQGANTSGTGSAFLNVMFSHRVIFLFDQGTLNAETRQVTKAVHATHPSREKATRN